jgi:hypothetical protein
MAEDISPEALERLRQTVTAREQSKRLLEESLETEKDILEQQKIQLDIEKEQLEILKLQERLGEDVAKNLSDQIEKLKKLTSAFEATGLAAKAGRDFIVDIGNKLGIATKESGGIIRNMVNLGRQGGSVKAVFQGMADQLGKTFGATNLIASSMEKIVESTVVFAGLIDQTRANFTAQTGIVGDLRTQFVGLTQQNLALGFTLERTANAQMALTEGFAGFVTLGPAAQNELTSQSVLMERLGVDTTTTAETINQLAMSFGMSRQEAMATQREIVGLGTALGMSASTISREFTAALPRLALYGDRATEVFKGMAIAARETGVSISELNQIFGSAMDTFEGTSRIAGRLNQVLGTDLVSGTELLMAREEERVNILRERLQLAGMDFKNMDRFQRIAVANAAGINDMTVAARLFGSAQNDIAMQLGNVGLTSQQLEERAGKAMSVMEKFKQIFFTIAIAAEPLADFMAKMVDSMLGIIDAFPGGGAGLLAATTAVGAGSIALLTTLAAPLLAAAVPAAAAAGAAGAAGFGAAGGTAAALGGGALIAAGGTALAAGAAGAMGGGTRQPIVVKVVLNEREMGQAVAEIVDGRVLSDNPRQA